MTDTDPAQNPYETLVDPDELATPENSTVRHVAFRLVVVLAFSWLGLLIPELMRRAGQTTTSIVEIVSLWGLSLCAAIWAVCSRRFSNRVRALMPALAGTIVGCGPLFFELIRLRGANGMLIGFSVVATLIATIILYVCGLFTVTKATAGTGSSVIDRSRSVKN